MASITREECQRTHEALNTTLNSIHEDIVIIRDNHLAHVNDKMEALQRDTSQKFSDNQKLLIIAIFLSCLALGIRVGEIAGLIP